MTNAGNCIRLHTAIEDTRWQEIYDTYDKKGRILLSKTQEGGDFFNTEKEGVTEAEENVTNRLIRGSRLIEMITYVDFSRAYCRYAADKLGSFTPLADEDRKVVRSISYHMIINCHGRYFIIRVKAPLSERMSLYIGRLLTKKPKYRE